jgi:hypothetical protein
MATTHPTRDTVAARRATVRHLADTEGLSARAIARRLNIGKDTVRRDLAATEPTTAPQDAPPPATSGATPAPRLLHPLDPSLVQDLNCLMDPRTGALPDPIRRYLRAAADGRRASMAATARRIVAEERATAAPATGRDHPRPQVAP